MSYHFFDNYGPDHLTGTKVTDLPRPKGGTYARFIKRFLDVLVVLIVAIPALCIVVPLALLIARDGSSPFYLQERVGKGGRIFRMIKLRTMVRDADAALETYLDTDPQARAEWEVNQKLRHDPRVTAIGHALRKSSMDELPQLWNVLTGDMSIVGPRPMMRDQQEIYPGTEYYAMRPGITGFWQTSVRNLSGFSERAAFDKSYYLSMSFMTDVRIILRTVRVVLQGTGC